MTTDLPLILVVDDVEDNRYTLTRRLQREGYTNILEAKDGREALETLEKNRVDLVLLDIMMPEIDGFGVLRHMKSDTSLQNIPVIIVSASEELDSIVEAVRLGAEDYIPKPFNPVLLKARIEASLNKKRLGDQQAAYLRRIEDERRRADRFLRAILPDEAVRELKASNTVQPRRFADVAILFCDIVGFTSFCEANTPELVVRSLGQIVERFESITERHQLEKIKTIGDAFLATGGLLRATEEPILDCIRAGRDMIAAAQSVEPHWQLRVGVHHGAVVAGILGKRQFQFDLWGDAVNTAARIAAAGEPGQVTISADSWMMVRDTCRGRSRGKIELKSKGMVELLEVVPL